MTDWKDKLKAEFASTFSLTESTDLSPSLPVMPLERILFSQTETTRTALAVSQASDSAPVSLLTSAISDGHGMTLMALSPRGSNLVHMITSSGTQRKLGFEKNISCIFWIGGADDPHLLLCACDGELAVLASGDKIVCRHSIGSKEKAVTQIQAVSAAQCICATEEGSIFIISFSKNSKNIPTLNHQLLIAANPGTLGRINGLSVTEGFLGISSEKSVVVLDISVLEKPKLIFKMHTHSENLFWLPGRNILVKGKDGVAILVHNAAGSFDHTIVHARVDGHHFTQLASGSPVFLLENNRTIIIAELVVDVGKSFRLQLLERASHALPASIALCGSSLINVSGPRTGQTILSVSLNAKSHSVVSIDLHFVQVMKWIEIIYSLAHSEKFIDAFSLLLDLDSNRTPLLLDRSTAELLKQQTFIQSLVEKFFKSDAFDESLFIVFAVSLGVLSDVTPVIDAISGDNWLNTVLDLACQGKVDPARLPHDVTKRVIEHAEKCVKEGKLSATSLDTFISFVVLRNGLIDTNQTIRIATGLDLEMATVLIHIYLLHDYVFPIQLFLSGPRSVDKSQVLYYLHCLSEQRRYPCQDGPMEMHGRISRLLMDEPALVEKILALDEPGFLSVVGFDDALFDSIVSKRMRIVGFSDELLVYGVNSYLGANSGNKFFKKYNKNSVLNILISRGDIETVLHILDQTDDASSVKKKEALQILERLVDSSAQSIEVVLKFISKFSEILPLNDALAVLQQKRRLDVSVALLANRGDFDAAVMVLRDKMIGSAYVQTDEVIRSIETLVKRYTPLCGEFVLVDIWTDLFKSSRIVDVADVAQVLPSGARLLQVIARLEGLELQSELLNIFEKREALMIHAAVVSTVDVGRQFHVLAKQDIKRNRATSVTASICHQCLDPLSLSSKKMSDLLVFSCGHIVHSTCGDGIGKPCPVCL